MSGDQVEPRAFIERVETAPDRPRRVSIVGDLAAPESVRDRKRAAYTPTGASEHLVLHVVVLLA